MKYINLFLFIMLLVVPGTLIARGIGRDPMVVGVSNSFELGQSDYKVKEVDGAILEGFAVCTNGSSANFFMGYVQDTIEYVNSIFINCWCRLTKPAPSKWVYAKDLSDNCFRDCAETCANLLMQNTEFRTAMFNSVE